MGAAHPLVGFAGCDVRVDWPEGGERVRSQVGTQPAILPRLASFTESAWGATAVFATFAARRRWAQSATG